MNSLSVLKRTIHTAAVTLVVLLIGQGETQAVQGLLRQSTPPADIGIGYISSGIGAPIACALTVGNPVNITNGNKYQREEDLVGLPGALPVSFIRHYNSRAEAHGPLGVGWRHNYQYQLGITGDRIIVLQGDGRLLYFDPTEDVIDGKRLYKGRFAKDGKLLADSIGYEWRLHDGKVLRFTKDGHLFDMRWQGSRILLHRDRDGRLLQISDSQDRRIRFGYDKRGRIISIMDPGERHTRYVYDDNNNLLKIIRPDETARTYHYENKRDIHNLTGITDERGVRFATWAYDDEDRAILSTHTDGVGEIRIQYGEGHRLVTDALGQVLTYTIEKVAGTPVITRVEGSGGEGCAADGVQYRYNDHLQLVSKSESNGLTRHYTYDDSGRLIQIAERAAAQTDAAGAVRLIAKYAYRDDESWPSLITEPSVAPEKTHQWWLSHNDQGRISEVLEVGYTPDFEGGYLEMVRTTRFTYKNGNLVTTDGPQTGDKDLVRYHYDSNGRFTHSDSGLTSGDRIETFDAYGRPSRLLDGRGQSTSLEYDDRGRLINLATQAQGSSSLNVSLEYDAVGHVTAVEGPNGRVSAEYDPAGRPISVTFPDGSRRQWHWDAKGRLLTRESHDKQGQRLVEQKNQYDLSGRLITSTNEEDEGYQYRYDPVGRLQKLINPLGQATGYRYDAWGQVIDIIRGEGEDQAVTESRSYDTHGVLISHTDGRGNTSTQRYDDFGHRLWRNTPDGGMVMYRYDDAGRVKARVDESGIINRFDYDEHGRLIGIGGFDQPATTHFHYTGDGKPQTLDGLRQQTRYTYDPTGRITEQA
ncbi:MAG: hypothetical protein KZQ75_09900, partial [Candidatus Thiodiazotropha sp. (ex Myrtea spinifera)]|nr:hypothetical protein [Candidatus Thiodiazotropha sp. (ex Myrtea spinifera)]